ncbi:hypothetical protein OPT61_g9315 [Boeremia exigua]|uniref:Uncharacterized protein n=1 Tax=Boeremia exigua TaxID=749465 RepID=A0ACC2HVE6_9PLEO|nr:hypothetical protein OPT61_g9315 [Boeremia exigua]
MLALLQVVLTTLTLSLLAHAQVSTRSAVYCATRLGPKSTFPVKTSSAVLTFPWHAYKVTTVAPKTTVTPVAVTSTYSATTILTDTVTPPQDVETFRTTTTSIAETTTIFKTEFQSTTITKYEATTITPTSTIAPPAGFVPIETAIPGSRKLKPRSFDDVVPAALELEARQQAPTKASIKNGKLVMSPAQYPQSVYCAGVVGIITTKTSTKTVKTTSTVTAGTPTSSTTTTFTERATTVLPPARASTTITDTEVVTSSTTVYETKYETTYTTTTETVTAPAATFYAACADNNIITERNGLFVSDIADFNDVVGAEDAYSCCVQCQTRGNCAGAVFYAPGGTCFILDRPATCAPNSQGQGLYIRGSRNEGLIGIGGPCGKSFVV